MIRKLVIIALVAGSAALGYYFGKYQCAQCKAEYAAKFNEHHGQQLTNGNGLQCKAIAGAIVVENRLGERIVTARAYPGTDTASLKIASDGQSIQLLTAASVRGGSTDADPMTVIGRTPSFIVAGVYNWPGVAVLMIDLNTRNALWTTTSFSMPGLIGESLYFECH